MTLFKKSGIKRSEMKKYIATCTLGEVISIERINDSVYSSKLLGDGFGIIPNSNDLSSPVNGTIIDIADKGLSMTIKTNDGLIVLINMVLNLTNSDVKLVNTVVNVGDLVSQGDLLCSINLEEIVHRGYKPSIVVVVNNSEEFKTFSIRHGRVNKLDTAVLSYVI